MKHDNANNSNRRELITVAVTIAVVSVCSQLTQFISLPNGGRTWRLPRIRDRLDLAVVIPFTAHDAPLLLSSIRTVWSSNPPCDWNESLGGDGEVKSQTNEDVAVEADLIFYFHTDILHGTNAGLATAIRSSLSFINATSCFRNVKFLNARLSESEDTYPLGPNNMFFKLWKWRTMTEGYDWMFYMEPDNRPCRRGWLDALKWEARMNSGGDTDIDGIGEVQEIEMGKSNESGSKPEISPTKAPFKEAVPKEIDANDSDVKVTVDASGFVECKAQPPSNKIYRWHLLDPTSVQTLKYRNPRPPSRTKWMLGSILRPHTPPYPSWSFSDHLNGNALYRISSQAFGSYVRVVELQLQRNPGAYVESYDIAIHLVARDRAVVSWESYARMVGRITYTDVVQNWYRTKVNATEICSKNPGTYFVHGREVLF